MKNKNIGKQLFIIVVMIIIFMGRQCIVRRNVPTDKVDRKSQGNMQAKELTFAVVTDENMKNQTMQPETLLIENNDKKPQKRTPTGNRYFDEAEAYRMVLSEHEYAVKSDIEIYKYDEWENVEDLVFYSGKRAGVLFYCLKDLSNDGHLELIIGNYMESEDAYWIDVIYHYSEEDGIVWSFQSEGMPVHLYAGGIIEMEGRGIGCHFLYYRFLPDDSGKIEYLGEYAREEQEDGTVNYFRYPAENDRECEISEKEYKETIGTYTAVPIELEYLPIDGFYEVRNE